MQPTGTPPNCPHGVSDDIINLQKVQLMAPSYPTLSPVKITLERWLQDKAEAAGFPFEELARRAGMTPNKLTICLRKPENAYPQEVRGLAEALGLHWYHDLVTKWGFGKRRLRLEDLTRFAAEEGMEFCLIMKNAA
jgi:hypothetical protein